MESEQPLEEWAPDAAEWAWQCDVAQPPDLGSIEDEVMRRRLPPMRTRDSALVSGVRRLVNLVLVLGSLAVLSAPLIGLVVVALVGGGTVGVGWLVLAQVAFVVALANVVSSLFKWSEAGRLRDPWSVLLTGVTGVLSAAALGLLLTQFDDSGAWAPMITGVAAVAGILGCVVVVTASTGAADTGLGRRVFGPSGILNLDPTREYRYVVARGQVLDILIRRGEVRVEPQRRDELVRMPLGAWRDVHASA